MHTFPNGQLFKEVFLESARSQELSFLRGEDFYNAPPAIGNNVKNYLTPPDLDLSSVLDLRSDYNKVILEATCSIYHLNIDTISRAVSLLNNTDYHIVIDSTSLHSSMESGKAIIVEYFNFMTDYLNRTYGNRVMSVNFSEYKSYVISNYVLIDSNHVPSLNDIKLTSKIIKKAFELSVQQSEPDKKVYLSRGRVTKRGPYGSKVDVENKHFTPFRMDDRVLEEERLEAFFAEQGFEIVIPENFLTIKEQVEYFYNVKTLVSVTSSGIANSIFMQPNSNILEIVTSFIIEYNTFGRNDLYETLHNQYSAMAHVLGNNYASIPNYNRDSQEIIDSITSSKSISGFLELENK